MARERSPRLAILAFTAAVAMAAVWVVAAPLLMRPFTGADTPLQAPSSLPLLALVCGGPLLVLALVCLLAPVAARHAASALRTGVIATSLIWLGFHAWVWWDRAVLGSVDANIGLGLLLLASPLVIAAAMTLGYQFPGRAEPESS